jgi:PmbA protein
VASAREGELSQLVLPRLARLPTVLTHVPRAAAATVADLAQLGHMVRDRLGGDRVDLDLLVERSLGAVRVANTQGLNAGYDVSLVSLIAEASRVLDGRRVVVRTRISGADLPSLPEVERLVADLRLRLAWSERTAEAAAGRQRIAFLPAALPALLVPVEQALTGKAVLNGNSPLARRRGTAVFSDLLTLRDDPLAAGRPGSRPLDDEGVPSRVLTLVQAGVVEGLLYDLETAGRVGAPPTGHGRRTTFGKPQPACTNVVLDPGATGWAELLQEVGDGMLLEGLRGPSPTNAAGGTFARAASLAWRVSSGEIIGLLPEVFVGGNAHDLLARVVAVGQDQVWLGARAAPPVVIDGVSVF